MISRNILQDEVQLLDWKQQLDRDVETLKAKSNICNIRSVSCNCLPFLKLEMLMFSIRYLHACLPNHTYTSYLHLIFFWDIYMILLGFICRLLSFSYP